MKYYLIAGEASGDLHASNVMREIKTKDSNAVFGFTGGDLMQEVSGVKADIHMRQMAFMGFVDVLKNIRTIQRNFKIVKAAILAFKPDILVLVDYPGFNLRMAKWAFENGIKVDYYISPTVWAWKENRVETIRKYVHHMFVILPFEKAFYAKHNMDVHFVGHPLIDAIEQKKLNFKSKSEFLTQNNLSDLPIIAVLPGSRIQEIERMLDSMVQVIPHFKGYQFVFAGSPHLPAHYYEKLKAKNIAVVFNQTYELMAYAHAGIIKSGTSTLESALFNLPQVVCYKGGNLSFEIGKRLVNVKYIGLPNLIMDKLVVKELVQYDFTVDNIKAELNELINNQSYRERILADYQKLHGMLGGLGASKRLAEFLVNDAAQNT